MKDAKGYTTFYEYGLFGVERILYPDSSEEYLVYDCVGNVIEKITGLKIIKYHYNASSQLIQIEYSDFLISFTHDENGNWTAMEDPQSTALYVYDSRNRLLSETKTVDGADYTTSYAYDAVSHLISTIYPDGTVVEQTYDNVGRVTSVNGYADYFWNETQLLQIQYANGVTTDYDYDTRGRPTHIDTEKNGNDLLSLSYAYDTMGNVLQMKNTEIVSGQQTIKEQWDYTYDSLNRLLTAAGGTSGSNYSLNYQYDSTGNRVHLNDTAYTYDEMNELISSESANETWTFTYDAYGNCTGKSDGVNTFEYLYDFENRLTAVKVDGQVTEEYTYDSDGRRIKKIDADSERVYIYSGANILYEVNKTTQMHAVYIYGPTGRLAKKVNDVQEYYHTDHLGSTKLVTSENGAVTEEIQYEPFGEQINATEERYTYNGKERDETGLYYYGARYYDPETGRFLTRDPLPGDLLSPQTLNSYVYCLNNPLRYVDIQGMSTDEVPTYPDGTYSSKLTELYNMLQQALNSMSAEDWAEIERLLNGTDAEKMKAIEKILNKAEIENSGLKSGPLFITFGTMRFDFEFVDFKDEKGKWGEVRPNETGTGGTIRIANRITKAGDLFLTLGHELIHANIMGRQGNILKSVEQQYGEELKNVFMELTSYEWESSVMSEVPNTSFALRQTVTYQHRIYSVWWNDPR